MKTYSRHSILLGVLILLLVSPSARSATTIEAVNDATVQVTGPRSGANGKAFINIEGTNNGNFASFGVFDFNVADFGLTDVVSSLNSITLLMTEANAAFTLPGTLSFYITTDTTSNIEPGTSTLTFNTSDPPGGLGAQLATLYLLGTGSFNTTGNVNNGQVDTYTFNASGLDPAASAYLVNALNSGSGTLRVIATPGTSTTAATFAGYSHGTFIGPQLQFDYSTAVAAPEPSRALLMMGGVLVMLTRRQRKVA